MTIIVLKKGSNQRETRFSIQPSITVNATLKLGMVFSSPEIKALRHLFLMMRGADQFHPRWAGIDRFYFLECF